MTDGRLRVILAGSVYPQPEGLRPFLEESGYEVLGEVSSPEELLDAIAERDADLLVLGPEHLDPERLGAVRERAPGAAIVAVSGERPPGLRPADGYVPSGSSLGVLTTELARVAFESAGARAAPARRWFERAPLAAGRVGPLAAAVAVIAGAWVLFATFPEGVQPPRATIAPPRPTASATSSVTGGPTVPVASPLEDALDSLERLVEAIRAGDLDRVPVEAEALARDREAAIAAGFEVGPLDLSVATRVAALTPDLPQQVVTQLRVILGDLVPPPEGGIAVTGDGAFGEVAVGTSSGPRPLVLSNPGRAAVTVVGVEIRGPAATQFSFTSDCVGATLVAGETCRIDVSFRPSGAGPRTAELRVELEDGPAAVVALSGTGVLVAPPDSEPPIVVCDPAGSGWSGSDVAVTCTARDPGSGLAQPGDAGFVLRASTPAGTETTNAQTDARTVCDREGNCVTVGPIGGIRIDKRAPDVSCERPTGGWQAANVEVSCTARDRGSGLGSDASFTLSTNVGRDVETADAQTGTRSVCDRVGNCSTAGPVGGIKVDRKPPASSCEDPPRGWQAQNVELACRATDGGAGVTNQDAAFTLRAEVAVGSETADAQTGTRSVCDRVGNCSTAGPVGGIKVDRKPPAISIGAPSPGAVYLLDQGVTAAFECVDGGSGTAVCQGSGSVDTASVGNRSFTVTARDAVGNEATLSVGYIVTYGVQLLSDPDEETRKVEIRLVNVDGINVSSSRVAVTALDLDGAPLNRRFTYIPGQQAYRLNIPGNVGSGSHVLRFTAEDDPIVHQVTFTTR